MCMYVLVISVGKVNVKWKNLGDTYKRKCNVHNKSGDGLADTKPSGSSYNS